MKKIALLASLLVLAAGIRADDNGLEAIALIDADKVSESGVPLPRTGYVSAGQPSEAAMKVFADAGYTTVIDLRTPEEDRGFDEPKAVEGLGMSYLQLPIAKAEDINFENAATLDAMLKSVDGPVLVHCGSANRVGALFALRASANGASAEEALAVGKTMGLTRLEKDVKAVLGVQ